MQKGLFNPKNILLVRNDRFGEFLLNIPAMRALKESFPGVKITAIVDPAVTGLAKSIPFIDQCLEWKAIKHPWKYKLKLISILRQQKIDAAVILNPTQEMHLITFLSGIPVRAGYNRKCGFLLTHKLEDKKYLGDRHEVEYNLNLVRLIGANTADTSLALNLDDDCLGVLIKEYPLLGQGDLVAVHPYTSDTIKQWPLEDFSNLSRRLQEELKVNVVIVGGKQEAVLGDKYFSGLSKAILNLTGKTSLVQLAALLRKCKLLITGDSGPMHLASAAGIPVVALFRNDLPGKNKQRWGPLSKGSQVIEGSSMEAIKPGEAFDAVKQILK